jgi:hypothetical protein
VGEVEDLTSLHPSGFTLPMRGRVGLQTQVKLSLAASTGPAGHGESDQRSEGHQDDNHDENGFPDTRQEPSGLEVGGE